VTGARIAILAHGHPRWHRGGGEMVAHSSFHALREAGAATTYLGMASPRARTLYDSFGEAEWLRDLGESEVLIRVPGFDDFLHNQRDSRATRAIVDHVTAFRPDIVHFHHFWSIGFDTIQAIRSALPRALLVLTLHEYLALCLQHGQMLTRPERRLCHAPSASGCHACYPDLAPALFAMRSTLVARGLALLDGITAPSRFLIERFAQAGIRQPIALIENGLDRPVPQQEGLAPDLHRRFAFFGQATPFKGLDVFVNAANAVLARDGSAAAFDIHGVSRADFDLTFGALAPQPHPAIRFHGAYKPDDVIGLMRASGWIVMPSIWWENAPVVIQEAQLAGRPMIVSDIGGMREKVRDGVDGVHFRARDADSLAATMTRCAGDAGLWNRLRAAQPRPPSAQDMNRAFAAFYATLPRPGRATLS
jgi:glycosyltransferase involved in cell wall biosynthesis